MVINIWWCKSWSHKFKECHGLKIFKICVQKGILGSKMENITRRRRKQHNGGLHDQRKESEMGRTLAGMGLRKGARRVLVGKPHGR